MDNRGAKIRYLKTHMKLTISTFSLKNSNFYRMEVQICLLSEAAGMHCYANPNAQNTKVNFQHITPVGAT